MKMLRCIRGVCDAPMQRCKACTRAPARSYRESGPKTLIYTNTRVKKFLSLSLGGGSECNPSSSSCFSRRQTLRKRAADSRTNKAECVAVGGEMITPFGDGLRGQ